MSAVVRRRDPRGDPLFDRVNLLITGNTQLKDESRSNATLTVGGGTKISPAPKALPGSAVLFDRVSTNDTLLVSSRYSGTQAFCHEFYVYFDAYPPNSGTATTDLYMLFKSGSSGNLIATEVKWNRKWSLWFTGGAYYQSPDDVPLGEFAHLACSREGNTFRMFINGKLQFAVTNAMSLAAETNQIGCDTNIGSRVLNGWLRDIRVTVGDPRYRKDFTPPPPGFSTFGVESRAAVVLPLPVEEPEPEPELGTESCASIVTAGLGGTVKPFMVTRGLGLCPGLQPVTPPAPQMTLYYEPERSDQTHHLRRKILREDQLLLEVITLAVTRILR